MLWVPVFAFPEQTIFRDPLNQECLAGCKEGDVQSIVLKYTDDGRLVRKEDHSRMSNQIQIADVRISITHTSKRNAGGNLFQTLQKRVVPRTTMVPGTVPQVHVVTGRS